MTSRPTSDVRRPTPDEDVSVLGDCLTFIQSRRGWRFGIDAVLLARHVLAGPRGAVLEVGTGCGVVAALLAASGWEDAIVAVEVQPALADRARRNVAANALEDRVSVVEAEARDLVPVLADRTFARVVSNPPFWPAGSGRTNPHPERAIARHELAIDMAGIMAVVASRLAPGGLATILYPAAREGEACAAAAAAGLRVVRTTPAVPGPGRPPRLVILDIRHGRGGSPERAAAVSMMRSLTAPDADTRF